MTLPTVLSITDASQVGRARREATRLAEASSFAEVWRGNVALVATELGNNLLKYGQEGTLILQCVERQGERFVDLLAIDSGPGIADVQRSLRDGVSTGGTPGTGLGAIRRLSHTFDIHSDAGRGTVVFASCAGGVRGARHAGTFEWSAFSTAAPGEAVSGDAWAVHEQDGTMAVMVADGLGHGPLAAEAAGRALDIFRTDPMASPAAFCDRAHGALLGTRGAAVAAARVAPAGRVTYAGVGNIAGTIVVDGKGRGLPSQNGTVGLQIRRMLESQYELPPRGLLVMHSDGLTNRWTLEAYPGLPSRRAAVIAGVLYRDCLRGKDDATVVVVKRGTGA